MHPRALHAYTARSNSPLAASVVTDKTFTNTKETPKNTLEHNTATFHFCQLLPSIFLYESVQPIWANS